MSYERKLGCIVFGGIITLLCYIGINAVSTEAVDTDDIDFKRFDSISCKRILISNDDHSAGLLLHVEEGIPSISFVNASKEIVLLLTGSGYTNSDGDTMPPSILVGDTDKKGSIVHPSGIIVIKNGKHVATVP